MSIDMTSSTAACSAIRTLRIWRVRLPLHMVYVSSMYIMDHTFRTVVEIETEDGTRGIGETVGLEDVFSLLKAVAKQALGRSVFDRRGFRRAYAKGFFDNRNGRNGWSAFAAIEMAMWDASARALNAPLSALLGGAVRESVEVICPVPAAIVDAPLPRKELTALFGRLTETRRVIDYALDQRARHGFRSFKYKSAGASAAWDAKVMRELRQALGPQVRLRWDPNAAYTVREALELARDLEPLALEFYEDPVEDIEGMARVRASVHTALATNMCVTQLDHLAAAHRRGALDVVLADVFMWGGIDSMRALSRAAPCLDMEPAVHSLFETSVGTAVNLHLAAALPEMRRPNDSGHHVMADDVTAGERLMIEDGAIRVPRTPGIGVELDRAALERLAVATLAIG